MLCRALLAAIAISYLVCVLFLSGIQKEDLDVALLKKLQHHNIDFNDPTKVLREQCDNITIRRSDLHSLDIQKEAIDSQNVTANKQRGVVVTKKYSSDEFNFTDLVVDDILNHLTSLSETTTDKRDELSTPGIDNMKNNITKSISETKSIIDEIDALQIPQTKPKSPENQQLKHESLQNIIRFWEEYNKNIKTATPMSTTTKLTTQSKVTLTTASSVTEQQDQNNHNATNLDEVNRISKLVAEFMLYKNNVPTQDSIEHKNTTLTTLPPSKSTSVNNPRGIEDKFALSLNAINKLNENIANLQKKLQASGSNKSNENEQTTTKLAERVIVFPQDSEEQISQNLNNEKRSNQDHHKNSNLLLNKHYKTISSQSGEAFKRAPDHDCTALNKHLKQVSRQLSIDSDYKNQKNPNNDKQTQQKVENTQEELYRDPNKKYLKSYSYHKPKENRVSTVNHYSHNESSSSDMVNYSYRNPHAANTYDIQNTHFNSGEPLVNVENSLDIPIINDYKTNTQSTVTHQISVQNNPNQYNSNTQNFVNIGKGTSNSEPNSLYNLETIQNGSPQVSTFKVPHYSYENIFLNNQTPINENGYYNTKQQRSSDETDQDLMNFQEKATNYARDIEKQIMDRFKNREQNHQNSNDNLKINQQYFHNDNSAHNFMYSGEHKTNNSRAEEQKIAINTFKTYKERLNHPQYKYVTEKIYIGAVQNLSKDRNAYEQSLLNYKQENNKDKVNLPPDMISQIAESVKQIILKDLKNEINTSLNSTSTSSPSTSYSESYQTTAKPVSLFTTSFDTITSTTLTTTVTSVGTALSLNETKLPDNTPVTNSPTLTIFVSTPRNTNHTDTIMERKIDRVQQATQAIEKFLDLFNKYSAAAQEKSNPHEKRIHQQLLAKSIAPIPQNAPIAMFPPPLPAVNPYHMRLQQKPVIFHHYVNPQVPTPPLPINLIPGLPVFKPLQFANQADPRQHPQPIMIQTNMNEIQPIRVPMVNFQPINVVVPTSSPFKNQEERNRWNFMIKYGRNPDKRTEIRNTKQSLDTYSHVNSMIYSSLNQVNSINEKSDDKKAENVLDNKTNTSDVTRLDPYLKYVLSKFNANEEKINKIVHKQNNNIAQNNEPEKSEYRPTELYAYVENINENRPEDKADMQYPVNNVNSTYYKNMATQFDALNTEVSIMNLNPSYANMIKEFGFNQNIKTEESDPNQSFYNQNPERIMLARQQNVESQTNKRQRNDVKNDKNMRFYDENVYFGRPRVEGNYYENGNIHSANSFKESNQDNSDQYNEKHLGTHVQVHNIMPVQDLAFNKQRPSDDHIKKGNIIPKNLARNKQTWVPTTFNINLRNPELKYNSDSLDNVHSKKHVKNKFRDFGRIAESPLQSSVLLTRPPTFEDLLSNKRIGPIGKYYDQQESSKHSVNKKGQIISRGHFDTSLNHHLTRQNNPRFESKREKNEKWQQHKARTSAILGRNRYSNKHSNEGINFDSDGRYREYRTQLESSDEKPRHNKKSYYDTSDSDKRYSNMEVQGFHEKLEGTDDWRSTHGNIFSRQQLPLTGRPNKSDDAHFRNFLKTQQKVNQMLEKILASKSEGLKSVEAI